MLIISPWSRKLRNNKENPKNYPYWEEVIFNLKNKYEIVQLSQLDTEKKLVENCYINLPLQEIIQLLQKCKLWISVDNFLPHLAHLINKPGIVIWGKSDPRIFGYPENVNLLKNRDFLRKNQFDVWEAEEFDPSVFVPSLTVLDTVNNYNTVSKRRNITNTVTERVIEEEIRLELER